MKKIVKSAHKVTASDNQRKKKIKILGRQANSVEKTSDPFLYYIGIFLKENNVFQNIIHIIPRANREFLLH